MAPASSSRPVYLPCDPATAEILRRGGELGPCQGIAVDEAYALARELDLSIGDEEEEADYWALTDAAMLGLTPGGTGPRFVLAARVLPEQVESAGPAGSGRVRVSGLAWSQVTALFIDEAEALPVVEGLRAVLDDPDRSADRAARLVVEHDLLWYAPDELDVLLG